MGCAPIAHILFTEYMKYNPSNPMWHDRDRFVLSVSPRQLSNELNLRLFYIRMDTLALYCIVCCI